MNLKGAWLGIKAALPLLRKRQGDDRQHRLDPGHRPMPGLFPYVDQQGGALGLTRQVAVECLLEGVTCNMVAPGWVDTPSERMIQARYGRPDFPAGIRNLTTPEEIGAAVAYLARPRAGRSTATSSTSTRACTSPTTPAWSTCPNTSSHPYEQRIDES